MKEVLFISCFSLLPFPILKKKNTNQTKTSVFLCQRYLRQEVEATNPKFILEEYVLAFFPSTYMCFFQLVFNSGFKHRLERLLSLICYSELIETHWIWFQFLVFNLFFDSFCTTGILSSNKTDSLERDSPQVTLRYFKDKITDFYRLAKHP